MKGPVPSDPEVRVAAIRLAQEQIQRTSKVRPLLIIGMIAAMFASIAGALTGSFWSLLYLLLYIPLFVILLLTPKRLRKRIALLSEPE